MQMDIFYRLRQQKKQRAGQNRKQNHDFFVFQYNSKNHKKQQTDTDALQDIDLKKFAGLAQRNLVQSFAQRKKREMNPVTDGDDEQYPLQTF